MAPLNQLLLFASQLLLGLFGLFVRRSGTLANALLLLVHGVQAELGDFFRSPTLTSDNFTAPLPKSMLSTSFERSISVWRAKPKAFE